MWLWLLLSLSWLAAISLWYFSCQQVCLQCPWISWMLSSFTLPSASWFKSLLLDLPSVTSWLHPSTRSPPGTQVLRLSGENQTVIILLLGDEYPLLILYTGIQQYSLQYFLNMSVALLTRWLDLILFCSLLGAYLPLTGKGTGKVLMVIS